MPKKQVRSSKTVTCGLRTDRQTQVLTTEYPIRASAFQASACDLSGPIYLFSSNTGAEIMITSVYMCRQTDIHECVLMLSNGELLSQTGDD